MELLRMPTTNEELIRLVFEELWNNGNLDVADEIFAPSYVDHDPAGPEFSGGGGPEGVKRFVATIRAAAPDVHFSVNRLVARGDRVTALWTATGTHTGDLLGIPPTGRQATVKGAIVYRVTEGKIVEGWHLWDTRGMLRQLGVIP